MRQSFLPNRNERIVFMLLYTSSSAKTLLACIVLTESAPHSAEIRREAFEEQVRNDLQAVQRDFHLKNLTCAECQGNTERNCTLGERQVQCNPGEVCTTLEAFNLDTLTTTVTRGCFDLTGLNCDDNPGCVALNTTGNIQSCDQFCCTISLCNAGTLTTVTPQTTEAPTTSPTTLAPTTPFFCDAILGQSGTFTSPNFPADYPNGITCVAVANIPANRQMRFSVDFIQLGDSGDSLTISNGNVVVLQFKGPLNTVVKRSVDDQSSYQSAESYNQDYKDYYYFDGRRKEEPHLHIRRKRQNGNVVTIRGGQTATVLSALVLITESIPSVATDFPFFEITKKFDDIETYNNDYAILKFQEQEPMENLTCASCEAPSERECTLNQTAVVCDQDPNIACLTFEAFNNFTMTTTFRRGCFLSGILCENACRSFNASQDACGGVLRGRGTFTSPGFPGNYPNNVRCEWRVFLPRRQRIVFRIVSLDLADPGDSLEFFDSGRVIRTFRGLSRRKRSPSHRQTTNEKVLGEGKDGYYDDQEYVDYYYYDGRRKREPYFYQRRKKRRQQNRIVIQGRNQVAGAIFQSDAAGNAAGFSTQFVQGAADSETEASASSESSDEN
ncbi:CUB domain-containing protein [Acropora cervicornis]|uniref:CUB domain-containing protein n=1 Tax=Acropora cervicornis TaxID=6130 RepID=A0AAD9QVM4_ACRCE|nr:CUB domain-containing protein [Acropora cervicornis]